MLTQFLTLYFLCQEPDNRSLINQLFLALTHLGLALGAMLDILSETLQLPRPWLSHTMKTIKHHKYGSMSQYWCLSRLCYRVLVTLPSHFENWPDVWCH